jgi:hypothetical protein
MAFNGLRNERSYNITFGNNLGIGTADGFQSNLVELPTSEYLGRGAREKLAEVLQHHLSSAKPSKNMRASGEK